MSAQSPVERAWRWVVDVCHASTVQGYSIDCAVFASRVRVTICPLLEPHVRLPDCWSLGQAHAFKDAFQSSCPATYGRRLMCGTENDFWPGTEVIVQIMVQRLRRELTTLFPDNDHILLRASLLRGLGRS